MEHRRAVGEWGEQMAVGYLERHGFRVVERNYHTTVGEIDIVAVKGGDYYFVEVKTRLDPELATNLAVTPSKRRKLQKTIRHYCYYRGVHDVGLITAVLVIFPNKITRTVRFNWAVFVL